VSRHDGFCSWPFGVFGAGCRREIASPSDAARDAPQVSASQPAVCSAPVPGVSSSASGRVTTMPEVVPRFVDVAQRSGIEFTYYNDAVPGRFFLPEVMGGGAAWIDYDGDGWLDLFVTNGCRLKAPDLRQVFAVRRGESGVAVQIRWPRGMVSEISGLTGGRKYVVIEPRTSTESAVVIPWEMTP